MSTQPAAIASHIAGPLESIPHPFARSGRVWRQGCSCGVRGVWTSSPGYAMEIFVTHFNRGTR